MANIKQVYNASTPVVWSGVDFATLGDTLSATSDAIVNSTDAFLSADLEIELTAGATATGTMDIYMSKSEDGTNYTTSELANHLFLTSVTPTASTATRKVIRIEQLPRGWKIVAENNIGSAITAGSMAITGLYLSNA